MNKNARQLLQEVERFDAEQELLLLAAFLANGRGRWAWENWQNDVSLDEIDPGSFRLLPQLFLNVQEQNSADMVLPRIKGVYRRAWYTNHLLFHHVAPVLETFREQGIEALVFGETALVVGEYGRLPLHGFKLLVPRRQAIVAISLLKKLKWTPSSPLPDPLPETYLSAVHAHWFRDTEGREIQLHWQLLPECKPDETFWQNAHPIQIQEVEACTLCPADQLLYLCVPGTAWYTIPLFLRAAAVMMALNQAQAAVDWQRLLAQAQKHRLVLPVRETLQYTHDTLKAPIPSHFLQQLHALPVSKRERQEYKFKMDYTGWWGGLRTLWFSYKRQNSNSGDLQGIPGFLVFLKYRWQLQSVWEIPLDVARRGLARVRGH